MLMSARSNRAHAVFVGVCALVTLSSAVQLSTLPTRVPLIPLRGGGEPLRRQLSHEDLKAEYHGTPDTADARVFAKDVTGGEHRSLWHDLPLFEVNPDNAKPTGALNFVCEIPKWTRYEIETQFPAAQPPNALF
jgi:hypothetical protein